jgi:hypothetical protein
VICIHAFSKLPWWTQKSANSWNGDWSTGTVREMLDRLDPGLRQLRISHDEEAKRSN